MTRSDLIPTVVNVELSRFYHVVGRSSRTTGRECGLRQNVDGRHCTRQGKCVVVCCGDRSRVKSASGRNAQASKITKPWGSLFIGCACGGKPEPAPDVRPYTRQGKCVVVRR